MDSYKCPHCNKRNCIRQVLFLNVESYGGGIFNLPCTKCGKIIEVGANREVKITYIRKSKKKREDADW